MKRLSYLNIIILTLVGAVALVEIFPYFWMVTGSLKDFKEITRFPPTLLPSVPQWQNYVRAWNSGPFLRYFINSLIVTFSILAIQLFLCCMAAYAFSKLNFPGRDLFFYIVIMCLIVPPQVRFIPIYIMLSKVNLINTYFALILPYATSAFGIFLIRQAFMGISDDIVGAARIDGATTLQIIFQIMAPMAKPTIVAFSLFSVVYHWNEYFWPLVMTVDDTVRTLPLGVAVLKDVGTLEEWHIIMSANMFVVTPVMFIFIFASRLIIKSFTIATLR